MSRELLWRGFLPLTIPVVLCRRPQITLLQDATGNLALPWKTLMPTPPLLAAIQPMQRRPTASRHRARLEQ